MPDIPASTSTGSTIAVGGVATDMIEVREDHDWYRINLTAGQSITITLSGAATGEGTLVDPYLNLRSSTGAILAFNDDSGGNRNAKIVFTAQTAGTYYIDAGAWDSSSDSPWTPGAETGYTGTGTYTLRVDNYVAPPLWNYDQIANQLVNGYWGSTGESARHFNVSQGGTITVNFGTLTTAERGLANAALAEWSDIIGVTFTTVTSGGQIIFDNTEDPSDPGPTAYSEGHFSSGVYTSADVRISSSWVNQYGTDLNSYSFQTYLHEIGHALGLGHAGNYNGDADYAADALYRNDAWSNSIMSYFDPRTDNTYFRGLGFTYQLTLTPMNGDIVAMQQMYGLSTTTRTTDTTYGFNSNAGRMVAGQYVDVYNAASMPTVAYTVFDSGGNDTLDYSGFSQNQLINLTTEIFSNVGSGVGNVMIARGTVIENAVGGSGNDTINGNAAANRLVGNAGADTISGGDGDDFLTGGTGADVLTGGTGNDTFIDARSSLNGDRIIDFGVGDSIVFADATLSGFTFNVSGTTLNYSGGSLTFGAGLSGTLVASAAATGGVKLAFAPVLTRDVTNDFNFDGRSDVIWRNDNGQTVDWLGQATGALTDNSANFNVNLGTSWHVVGTGDFNGDGRDDILWRNDNGQTIDFLSQANGTFLDNRNVFNMNPGLDWHVMGTGDFDGDGRDDILWRNDIGTVVTLLGAPNGSFVGNVTFNLNPGLDWHVEGTGDFNGDGRDDILWRNDIGNVVTLLGHPNGSFVGNVNFALNPGLDWHIVGTGDFNGDGYDDILWRNDAGTVTDLLGQPNGSFVGNVAVNMNPGAGWEVAATGDYNGDGRDDVLWRNSDGTVTNWLGQTNGSFVSNLGNANYHVDSSWHVQPTDGLF